MSGIGNQFGGAYSTNRIIDSSEEVCYCGYLIRHWGHFLLDVVSRLWYAVEHDDEVSSYVFIVKEFKEESITGNYLEFFRLLGIANKVKLINAPTRFRKVLVPESAFVKKKYYSKKFISVFDRVITTAYKCEINALPEKVYLSRNHFRGKNIEMGLDFVDHYFRKNGFEIVYPEEVSLSQLIRMLQAAKVCASESGTLTHNFLFAQQGKEVIIVERQVTINDYQCNVDIIKDLHPIYIDANYEIYTTAVGYGPYLLGYTKCFQRFTEDYGYKAPDAYYTSEKYAKKCLARYIKACDTEYGYKRQYCSWQMISRRAIMEAYEEALEKFRPYLEKKKPLFWWQAFQPRYIKALLKRLLRR